MRTIIEVPDELIQTLDQIGQRENCSRAALIREAIVEYLQQKTNSSVESAFGLWKDKGCDGVEYQNTLRSEWGGK